MAPLLTLAVSPGSVTAKQRHVSYKRSISLAKCLLFPHCFPRVRLGPHAFVLLETPTPLHFLCFCTASVFHISAPLSTLISVPSSACARLLTPALDVFSLPLPAFGLSVCVQCLKHFAADERERSVNSLWANSSFLTIHAIA